MRTGEPRAAKSNTQAAKSKAGRAVSHWGFRVYATMLLVANSALAADASPELIDEIPPLRPPRAEIPPTFWEQHGLWITLLAVFVIALLGLAIWFLTRPQPAIVVPPEVTARQALKALEQTPEEGQTLSRISRIIRIYLTGAFNLAGDELTTAELASLLEGDSRIGPDLSQRIIYFLRQCDERKFGLEPSSPPLPAVAQANKLIELTEARRAYLRDEKQAALQKVRKNLEAAKL